MKKYIKSTITNEVTIETITDEQELGYAIAQLILAGYTSNMLREFIDDVRYYWEENLPEVANDMSRSDWDIFENFVNKAAD